MPESFIPNYSIPLLRCWRSFFFFFVKKEQDRNISHILTKLKEILLALNCKVASCILLAVEKQKFLWMLRTKEICHIHNGNCVYIHELLVSRLKFALLTPINSSFVLETLIILAWFYQLEEGRVSNEVT